MGKSEGANEAVLLSCTVNEALNKTEFHNYNTSTQSPDLIDSSKAGKFSDVERWLSSSFEPLTLSVQNLHKSYESSQPVLANLCMTVKTGTIYSLLGSSGCGKTTLLSCIVGLTKWDNGELLVFGSRPNAASARRIGYMPQDIALYDQISVRETIGYYGRLYGMTDKNVESQWQWLIKFLQLPSSFKLIKDLSGGQKRRVSLAVTLVHSPELLILDEPTVGMDPLLRESIWEHLVNIVRERKTTVLITTHYVEEAKCSNTIGLMRKGRLVVEDSPESLLDQYQCNLLEQVMLKLCRKDEQIVGIGSNSTSCNHNNKTRLAIRDNSNPMKTGSMTKNNYNVYGKFQENWQLQNQRHSSMRIGSTPQHGANNNTMLGRIRALSTVIWLMFMRHPVFISMVLFLPTLQMILTLAVLGTHPKDLHFGVVNYDNGADCFNPTNTMKTTDENTISIGAPCNSQILSCNLVEQLGTSGTLKLISIQTLEDARKQVLHGDLWGYFYFPSNYSSNLVDFAVASKFANNETLDNSRVHLYMDMSHYLGAAMSIRAAFEAYERFAQNTAVSCGLNSKEFQLPMMYRHPIYGNNDVRYHDYVIPIIILTVIFEIPMLVTSIIFISDRKQGTLDRARVAGLRFKEVMMSHFITQGSIIIGQTAICSFVLHVFYGFRVEGNYVTYILLGIIGGLCGESLGLLLGVIFKEEVESVMFGIFIGPILLMYEGVVWPLQGMSKLVRHIAYMSPTTLMVESLRSVIYKGVGLTHQTVWPGVAVLVGWTIFFWVISIWIFIKNQK